MQHKIETRIAERIDRECKLIAEQMGEKYPSGSISMDMEIENRVINGLILNLFYGSEGMK